MPEKEIVYSSRPISKEEESKLINRVYHQHMALKASRLEELDLRYYPMAPPLTITPETLKASIKRQVDDEMTKRKMKQEEAAAARAVAARSTNGARNGKGGGSVRVLNASEVEASVERMYTEAIEKSKMKREQLVPEQIKRERQNCLETKIMEKSALQAAVNRLSVPKKTTFTTEEINKMYGLPCS